MVDLTAFNAKAVISAVLQHVKNVGQTLRMSNFSLQGMAKSLRKARQSLEEGWQDTQTVSFANMGITHAAIIAITVGVRAVHASIWTLRVQALSIGTSTHGQGLVTFTKDIPISSTGLLGGVLSKAVGKAASASRN